MLSKLKINSELEILTGLHIGGNSAFAAIGAVDSPVVRDSLTMEPIIPGSSLKGKIRSLLSKKYNQNIVNNPNEDDQRILRLFGKANDGNAKAIPSRLLFFDVFTINKTELEERGIQSLTEVKFENNINRITSKATPRQIERVIKGTKFDFNIVYDVLNIDELKEDLSLLYDGIQLLEEDYLGGSGTRGYGRVKFNNFHIEVLNTDEEEKKNIESIAKDIFKV